MRSKIISLAFLIGVFDGNLFSQTKTIGYQELPDHLGNPTGSGIFLGATMTPTDITITFSGPSDRWIALGIGSLMDPTDVFIYSSGKTGATHTLDWFDYYNSSSNATGVNKDITQNWTVTSNTVQSGLRTVVAARILNTSDVNDLTLSFSDANLNVVWAKGSAASYTISYHGSTNRAAGIVLPWTIPDVTPPTLASSSALSPADNATGVALGTNMSAAFSENVQLGTGLISLYLSNGTLVESFDVATSTNVSVNNSSITINPTNDLLGITNYYIQIAPTAIKDLAGNFYGGITDNSSWNFTTLDNTTDVTPPTLATSSALSPADNATGVDLGTNMSATFSENVQLGTGLISLYLSNGTLVESYDVSTSTNVSVNGSSITMNPTNDLLGLTNYYIQIAPTAIKDLAGNFYSGITDNSSWNFTTLDNTTDVTAPQLAASPFVPADNSTTASTTNDFQVSFNEDITLGSSGLISLYLANGTLVESYDVSNSNLLSISGSTLTINPTNNLLYSTAYYCTIDNGAIKDLAANAYSGFNDNTTWDFITESNPSLGLNGLSIEASIQVKERHVILQMDAVIDFCLKIYDTQGKLICETKNQKNIDLSKEKSGIYFINIEYDNQIDQSRIFLE